MTAPAAWALRTDLDLEALCVHLPALEAAGLLGIAEEDGRATAYLLERVEGLGVDGNWEPVPDRDWHERWKASIAPVTVGAVTIVPPWLSGGDARIAIEIEPGQAFGTGHHETTTGCLAALQELDLAGRSVLDVGTGSGVLAIAAARLGARRVVGVDTDPLAVEAAGVNAARNGVEIAVGHGSVEAAEGVFDVVVANLDTTTLSGLAGALVARIARPGTLVASGVSVERRAEAEAAFAAAGLPVLTRPGREWVVLVGHTHTA